MDDQQEAWPQIAVEEDEPNGHHGDDQASVRFANRLDILAIPDIETRDVYVPEWTTTIRVRALSSIERDRILDSNRVGKGRKERLSIQGIEAKFVIAAAVDQDGKPLFQRGDLHALMGKSAGVISRLYQAIADLSGLGDEAEETARGNSLATTPNGASPSG